MNIFWPRGFTVPLSKKRRKNPFFPLFIIHGFKLGGDSVIKIFFYIFNINISKNIKNINLIYIFLK
jgi:hypothetical protein